jgi:S1-C subfamily serine protease
VMDHPTVALLSRLLGPVEGLVGFPFFSRYRMTIDYQARELTLTPSGYKPQDTVDDALKFAEAMVEESKRGPRILAPAAQWGFVPTKEKTDEDPGVKIETVFADSAAAAAGLKVGDRLLTLDGRWTDSVTDTYEAARHVKAGTATQLVVQRGDRKVELKITPRSGF